MQEKCGKRDKKNKRQQGMQDDMVQVKSGKTTPKLGATGVEEWVTNQESVTLTDTQEVTLLTGERVTVTTVEEGITLYNV